MPRQSETTFDADHLEWAIENRTHIQQTLLALYTYLRDFEPHPDKMRRERCIDDLIAAAFSLWRAAFLDDKERMGASVHAAQMAFLETVLSTNAVTFGDDRRNSAWSVTFYLENAKARLRSAQRYAQEVLCTPKNEKDLIHAGALLAGTGYTPPGIQYEWRSVHASLRILFRALHPTMNLPIRKPK